MGTRDVGIQPLFAPFGSDSIDHAGWLSCLARSAYAIVGNQLLRKRWRPTRFILGPWIILLLAHFLHQCSPSLVLFVLAHGLIAMTLATIVAIIGVAIYLLLVSRAERA